jgi:uncharacterized protein (DUF2147 family)
MTGEQFFEIWKRVCKKHETQLVKKWNSLPAYTDVIFESAGRNIPGIVKQIGEIIDMTVFREYYHLDAVFYDEGDLVKKAPPNKTWGNRTGVWLRKMPIAFEHENNVGSAYQEVSHLITTNAEMKVLVTYADETDTDNCATDFQSIVEGVDTKPILVIFGYQGESKDTIEWEGYVLDPKKGKQKIRCK